MLFIKKINLCCLNKLERRELYHIQISENYKTPTLQSYYKGYFIIANLDWKLIHFLSHTATVDTKLKIFHGKILNNIHFVNNILFKFKKFESPPFSFCKGEDENYNISFMSAKKLPFHGRSFRVFLVLVATFLVFCQREPSLDSQMII